MADLRIFSYMPNPRLYKCTIAAALTGVELEIRGSRPKELPDWLWDFDARPLTDADRSNPSYARKARAGFAGDLYKTDEFLQANPYGTVPVAFSPDGRTGIFESNSMLRTVARLARSGPPLYGRDAYEAARIDGFLDVSLNFAHVSQRYLFAVMGDRLSDELNGEMEKAVNTYLGGIDTACSGENAFIVGDTISLADICFAAELVLFAISRTEKSRIENQGYAVLFNDALKTTFPAAFDHFDRLLAREEFQTDLAPYFNDMTLAKFMS